MKVYIKSLAFCILNVITLSSFCQPVGSTFYVTTYYDGTSNIYNPAPVGYNPASYAGATCPSGPCYYTIRNAIEWANNYAGTGPITIDINGHNPNPGQIVLFNDLPPINLANNNLDLTITANKPIFQGFKAYEGLQNNLSYGHNSLVSRCLEINTNYSGGKNGTVKLQNLTFTRWNVTLFSRYSNTQYEFAPCVFADNTRAVTITNCDFIGYHEGVLYTNNIGNMNISNCNFNSYFEVPQYWYDSYVPHYGDPILQGWPVPTYSQTPLVTSNYTYPYYFTSAIHLIGTHILPLTGTPSDYKTTISGNLMTNIGTTTEHGAGIIINPIDCFNGVSMTSQYNVRADISIINNQINDLAFGISQGFVPPIRTSIDNTYKLKIDNNILNTRINNVTFGAPYNTFILTNNTFGLSYNQYKYSDHPQSLHFGSSYVSVTANPLIWDYLNLIHDNQFGFDIIDVPSSTPKNNSNSFSLIQNYPTVHSYIGTEGNFGPGNVSGGKGINFVNFKYPGFIDVGTGSGTSLSKCTLKPSTSLYTSPIPPIHFSDSYYNVNPTIYVAPNNNIPAPTLLAAYITTVGSAQQVQIQFSISDPFFTNNVNNISNGNGPYVIEFFKSNDNTSSNPALSNPYGDVGDFLYSMQVTGGLSSYIATFNPPLGTTFTYGDRVAAHVTALGTTGAVSCSGTSPISYLKLLDCPRCLGDFSPLPGKSYLLTGWCKIDGASGVTTYNNPPGCPTPALKVVFYSDFINQVQMGSALIYKPVGPIIDSWQKIEGKVDIPINAKGIKIEAFNDLSLTSGPPMAGLGNLTYFDDIRFHPMDASMKSYVYEPDFRKPRAELDENNYATFYEYDEEGNLIRVKKETEKGIMTIKESRNNKPIR